MLGIGEKAEWRANAMEVQGTTVRDADRPDLATGREA